jgi:glutamine---fructose-6-phosphate transaminase (isomerizing)
VCGIAGYVGRRDAIPVILDCLERLQYRGYDSSGCAVVVDDRVECARAMGDVSNLRKEVQRLGRSSIGIGHTRWATHGRPSILNTHPVVSADGRVAAVHNGVIENWWDLRSDLESNGVRFSTETDSEVIPQLVSQWMSTGLTMRQAFAKLPVVLQGSYAIVLACAGERSLFLTRRRSPLVVGVGQEEYFPASDIPSFLPFTSKVVYLKEGACYEVGPNGLLGFASESQSDTSADDSAPTEVDPNLAAISKGDFDHFMIKEIIEQAGVLAATLARSPANLPLLAAEMGSAEHTLLVGTGTSFHSALFAEQVGLQLGLRNLRGVVSSEMDHYVRLLGPKTLAIFVSQSGETADTLHAASLARASGAKMWSILNVPASSLGRVCSGVIPINCGPELAVAATKSYVAQLSIFTQLICLAAGTPQSAERYVRDAEAALYDLTSDSARAHVRSLATDLADAKGLFLLGRRLENITAREGALKLKEVAGLRAEAFFSGEMKHGPLALVEDGTPVVVVYREADRRQSNVAANELSCRGARIVSIGANPLDVSDWHIRTDDIGWGLPITQIVPIQVLSYEIAKIRGLNPDRPRHLAKSVTVN